MASRVGLGAKALLCVLVSLVWTTVSHADTAYLFTVSGGGEDLGIFTLPATMFSFIEPTLGTSGDATAITNIGGQGVTEFAWNSDDQTDLGFGGFPGTANACFTYSGIFSVFGASCFPFDPGSFLAAGTYSSQFPDILGSSLTVTIQTIAVSPPPNLPEPSSLILLILGMLVMLLHRTDAILPHCVTPSGRPEVQKADRLSGRV
jgi:hypothetical protein